MIKTIQKVLEAKDIYLHLPEITPTKYLIERVQISPCKLACPIDTDVKAYLGLIVAKKFEKALDVVKKDNPLPGICGRVCTHPCEIECSRYLSICALKRFLADYESRHGGSKVLPVKRTKKEKIAIIGSGPAGLTAANDLIRLGYSVTIFEALPVTGGMLSVGIPSFRLPRGIIQHEIDSIKKMGVEIKTNTRINDLNSLKKKGYKAILLAIGAHKGLKLGIPGEDKFSGLLDATTFLKAINLRQAIKIGKKVIVIGGGNAAIDAARTAQRNGSDVSIFYRRSKQEMPADPSEIEQAEKEGVSILYLASPIKILDRSIQFIKNKLGEPDASGRRRPIPIKGSEFIVETDTIIPAISQEPDLSFLPENHGIEISKWNTLVVNEDSLSTNITGIFAAGDAVTGPKTVIDGIASGHKVASSIHKYLSCRRDFPVPMPQSAKEYEVVIEPETWNMKPETRNLLTEQEAIEEAKRCLKCGPCAECIQCIKECDKRLVVLSPDGGTPQDCGVEEHSQDGCATNQLTGSILLRVPLDLISTVAPRRIAGWKNTAKMAVPPITYINGELSSNQKKIPVIIEPITAQVNPEFCRGCGDCEQICEYSAITMTQVPTDSTDLFTARVDQSLCKGCGICVSVCPTGAITQGHFTNTRIENLIEQIVK